MEKICEIHFPFFIGETFFPDLADFSLDFRSCVKLNINAYVQETPEKSARNFPDQEINIIVSARHVHVPTCHSFSAYISVKQNSQIVLGRIVDDNVSNNIQ